MRIFAHRWKMIELDEDIFLSDFRNRYTLRMVLVEIAEASATLSLHILRNLLDVRRIEGYTRIFDKLVEHGVLSQELSEGMRRFIRLRNLIIHRYWEVDDIRIYREAKGSSLEIISRFLAEVEDYVSHRA